MSHFARAALVSLQLCSPRPPDPILPMAPASSRDETPNVPEQCQPLQHAASCLEASPALGLDLAPGEVHFQEHEEGGVSLHRHTALGL